MALTISQGLRAKVAVAVRNRVFVNFMAAVMSRVITLPPLLQIACLSHRYFMYHRVLAEDSKEKERGNAPPVEIVNMFSSSRLKAYAEKAKERFDDICNICAVVNPA